jgi:hypothetical protein
MPAAAACLEPGGPANKCNFCRRAPASGSGQVRQDAGDKAVKRAGFNHASQPLDIA